VHDSADEEKIVPAKDIRLNQLLIQDHFVGDSVARQDTDEPGGERATDTNTTMPWGGGLRAWGE